MDAGDVDISLKRINKLVTYKLLTRFEAYFKFYQKIFISMYLFIFYLYKTVSENS